MVQLTEKKETERQQKALTPMLTGKPCMCGTFGTLVEQYKDPSETGDAGLNDVFVGEKLFAFGLNLNSYLQKKHNVKQELYMRARKESEHRRDTQVHTSIWRLYLGMRIKC